MLDTTVVEVRDEIAVEFNTTVLKDPVFDNKLSTDTTPHHYPRLRQIENPKNYVLQDITVKTEKRMNAVALISIVLKEALKH